MNRHSNINSHPSTLTFCQRIISIFLIMFSCLSWAESSSDTEVANAEVSANDSSETESTETEESTETASTDTESTEVEGTDVGGTEVKSSETESSEAQISEAANSEEESSEQRGSEVENESIDSKPTPQELKSKTPELRPGAILLDKIIAIVDEDIIMQSEHRQRINSIINRLQRQGTAMPPRDIIEERVLDQLILESIQLQMAYRAGIRIGDSQLNETLQSIARQNNMTLEQFEAQLALEGDSYANAREQIRREMIVTRVQQREVDRRVRVTEQEVEAFLASKEGRTSSGTEYLLGHILIALPESATEAEEADAKARADQILTTLQAGEDFKKTAIAHSDGRQALNGGVIGWRKENELPTIAANIIPNLAINQPSQLIRTGSGFHIVTVFEKKGGQVQLISQSLVRHILITPTEIRTNEQAKEIIDKLYERIQGGDDFATIAKSNSDDPVSAIDGGNLDWVSPGQMVPAFEQAMNTAKVGELTRPFESPYGWHILEVTDRREKDMSDTIMSNQAQRIIHQRKYEEELSNWLLEIKDEAFIEIKDDKLAKDATKEG